MWNRKQFPPPLASQGRICDRVSRNKPHAHKTAGRVGIKAPAGWSGENAQFVIDQEDSTDQGRLVVTPPPDAAPGAYPSMSGPNLLPRE